MTDPDGSELVSTDIAASAFGLQAHELCEKAELGVVHFAATDENGQRLWALDDLRTQVVAYLEEHGGQWPNTDDTPR